MVPAGAAMLVAGQVLATHDPKSGFFAGFSHHTGLRGQDNDFSSRHILGCSASCRTVYGLYLLLRHHRPSRWARPLPPSARASSVASDLLELGGRPRRLVSLSPRCCQSSPTSMMVLVIVRSITSLVRVGGGAASCCWWLTGRRLGRGPVFHRPRLEQLRWSCSSSMSPWPAPRPWSALPAAPDHPANLIIKVPLTPDRQGGRGRRRAHGWRANEK